MKSKFSNYPGVFYGVYKSSNDAQPRFYFDASVERNAYLDFDFSTLPFVQNSISIEQPILNIRSAALYGFATNSGVRARFLLDQSRDRTNDDLYFEGSLFDNYLITPYYRCQAF